MHLFSLAPGFVAKGRPGGHSTNFSGTECLRRAVGSYDLRSSRGAGRAGAVCRTPDGTAEIRAALSDSSWVGLGCTAGVIG